MEFIAKQLTTTTDSKRFPKFKIYENKIYYVWNEYDVDDFAQIWFATSNLDGSEFIKTQLTNYTISSLEPEFYIYNNLMYITWHAFEETTTKNQIYIASVQLDGSNLTILYNTTHSNGARRPKIAVKNDIIYLAYEASYYNGTYYHHMMRGKLNLDGTNFSSIAASSSPNEVVYNVELFVPKDPIDTKIYYIWTRRYFIGDPAGVHIWSADDDLSNFTNIEYIANKTSRNLYVVGTILYFSISGLFCKINTDGSNYEELLSRSFSIFQITDDLVDFAISNQTSSDYPTKTYQLLSAFYNISTEEYSETELANELVTGFNDNINLQFTENNNDLYYVWQQYDENNRYQIWLGILSDDLPNLCENVICDEFCDGTTRYYNGICNPETGECLYDVEENSEDCGYIPPDEPKTSSFPWWMLGFLLLLRNDDDEKTYRR